MNTCTAPKNKVYKIFIVVYLSKPFLFLFGSIYMMKELHTETLRYTIFIVCDMVCMFSLTEDLQYIVVFYVFQPENKLLSTEDYETLIKVGWVVFVCVFKGPSSS